MEMGHAACFPVDDVCVRSASWFAMMPVVTKAVSSWPQSRAIGGMDSSVIRYLAERMVAERRLAYVN